LDTGYRSFVLADFAIWPQVSTIAYLGAGDVLASGIL
jgi:hypothetical protein